MLSCFANDPDHKKAMRAFRRYLAIYLIFLAPIEASSRDGKAIWDSRCEECHGDPKRFASKYLWNIAGELQGQHHVDNLELFMSNHYIPDHEIETIDNMLLSLANSPTRYQTDCAECHGDANEYVKKTFWVGNNGITVIVSGKDVGEFLSTHQELRSEDVDFYLRFFSRVAGNPLPLPLPVPALR